MIPDTHQSRLTPRRQRQPAIRHQRLIVAALALTVMVADPFKALLAPSQSGASSSPLAASKAHPHQASNKRSRPPSTINQLQRAIEKIISQPRFATTRWGILIESLDRKRVLFSHEAHQLFVPASNLKLYTTAAALVHLGPAYRFRTSIFAAAPPNETGVIHGDIILYGRGDPNLSSRASGGGSLTSLDSLAAQLYQAGIREIHGDVIGDESYFSGPPLGLGWEWDDLQWSYGAEISALSVDDNVIELTLLPNDTVGAPAKIFTEPETSYVTIINKTVTASTGESQDIGIHRGLEDNVIEIWGRVPTDGSGFQGYVAVHEPALYAATVLAEALNRRGIKITGQPLRADAEYRQDHRLDVSKLKELASIESIPLSDELRILNKISQNLHAESLLRTLGAVVTGEATTGKGTEVVQKLLQSVRARQRGIAIQDGSGLSRQNLVTPASTVDLLRYMYQHAQPKVFIGSLPVAGVDGTLESRMRNTPAQANLRAKTGTLRYISTLSGYVTSARGEHLVFSIMANDHTGQLSDVTEAADEIGVLLAEFGG